MCIIVAVPANVQMPSDDVLKECFRSNPDGAGFMFADGKRVKIRKGFMKWEDFVAALDAEQPPKNSGLVMHFRIATHGKVQPSCCHPFPVSAERDDLKATSIDCRWGVAHNGIISGRNTNTEWSDSMDFIHSVIVPLARMNPSFIHSSDAIELLEGACDSKLAIMDNAGDIALVGNFIEDDGVFYSNSSYLPLTSNWSSYQAWWRDYNFGGTFGKKEDEAEWDDIDKLVAELPWKACQLCEQQEECAYIGEQCESEYMAVKACAYYSQISEYEIAEVCEVEMPDSYEVWDIV